MNIYEKLNAARAKFHELKLTKTGHNTFAKYHYFELGDFLIPGLQVMRDAGLCPLPVTFDKDGMARMSIVDIEKPDDRIVFESPMGSATLKGCHEVQNIGAVETYQRRYLWVAALEIVEHDALDATTGRTEPERKRSPVPNTFRSSPTMGSLEALSADEQIYIKDLAQEVADLVTKSPTEAVGRVESENLEDIQKMALWSLLDSKTRSTFKKTQQSMREAALS